ncbi:MAG: glycosyltransferase, partial [Pyrinomonadaceae bacterium]
MTVIFYILSALLIYFSYRSLRGGFDYLNYFKNELARPRSTYAPFATVIAPCKGLDDGLRQNLLALLEQDYPEYEVIFVVDDERDPAIPVIEMLLNRRPAETLSKKIQPQIDADGRGYDHGLNASFENSASQCLCGSKLIIAPKATDSSQKVENLREAIMHASDKSQVFVFVDSDTRPAKEWLRSLVAPLKNKSIGTTTGYRWFISKNPTFASELRNIWNASIASALDADTKNNFCWGGSMAIQRDTFEELNIGEKWRGTLSDDFTVTRAMWEAKLPIHFVPQALTASIEDCTFREMLEFTTRQMKITRVYAQKLWLMSFFGSGLFCAVMIASFAIIVLSGRNNIPVFVSIATIVLVSVCSVSKSWLRLNAARLALPRYKNELQHQYLPHLTLWLLSPAVFLYNCVVALFSRTMTWRGIRYKMI